MADSMQVIEHPGVVIKIFDKRLEVMILSQSACSSCHAKGACTAADMEEKIVEVADPAAHNYVVGQQVTVFMQQRLGTRAVFFGYILPFLLMVLTLIVLISNGVSEPFAGLTALLVLVPYYIGLYFLRDRLDKTFLFAVKPTSTN